MALAPALYSRWVTTRHLTEAELNRVLPTLIEGELLGPLEAFLEQPNCTEAHATQLRDSGNRPSFAAWYASSFRTTESIREFVATNPVNVVSKMLQALSLGDVTQALAEAAWDLDDMALRIELIKRAGGSFRPPKTWGAWLIAAAPFTGYHQSEDDVWSWCTSRAPRFVWEAALAAGNFTVMAKVCTEQAAQRLRLTQAFGVLEDYLETATADSTHLEDVVTVVTALATSVGDSLVGSPELTLATKAYQIADPAWGSTQALRLLLSRFHVGSGEYAVTYAEACEALASGPVDTEPVLTDEGERYDPASAARAAATATVNPREFVDGLCSGATTEWVCAFIQELWENSPLRLDYQGMCALQHLDDGARTALIEGLPDPTFLRLDYLDLGTDETVLRRPVPSFTPGNIRPKVADRMIALMRSRYGTNEAGWSVLETLLDSFPGSFSEAFEATEMVLS